MNGLKDTYSQIFEAAAHNLFVVPLQLFKYEIFDLSFASKERTKQEQISPDGQRKKLKLPSTNKIYNFLH